MYVVQPSLSQKCEASACLCENASQKEVGEEGGCSDVIPFPK